MLPRRIPKKPKRATRWRSQAHTNWIRGFACCVCGSTTNIAAAHVRLGSHSGISQKPDDWRTVPLCDGPHGNAEGHLGCHNRQHIVGERTFWSHDRFGNPNPVSASDVEQLIEAFIKASPKRAEINHIRKERADG